MNKVLSVLKTALAWKCAETHVNRMMFPQAHWTHYVAPGEKSVRGFGVSEQQLGTSYLQGKQEQLRQYQAPHINHEIHTNKQGHHFIRQTRSVRYDPVYNKAVPAELTARFPTPIAESTRQYSSIPSLGKGRNVFRNISTCLQNCCFCH